MDILVRAWSGVPYVADALAGGRAAAAAATAAAATAAATAGPSCAAGA